MQLYLQFGYGMMDHTMTLLKEWGGGGVILSPRDLEESQMIRVASAVKSLGAEPLLDPQCYLRDADHARLTNHRYWQTYQACSTATLLGGSGARDVSASLGMLNRALGVRRHILPGLLAQPISEDWFLVHERFIDAGRR